MRCLPDCLLLASILDGCFPSQGVYHLVAPRATGSPCRARVERLAADLWPLATRAQQRAMPVIGFLDMRSAAENTRFIAEFRQGLAEAGYVEGRNVAIEFRWAEGRYDRLPALAEDLVRRLPAVIVTTGAL